MKVSSTASAYSLPCNTVFFIHASNSQCAVSRRDRCLLQAPATLVRLRCSPRLTLLRQEELHVALGIHTQQFIF